MGLRRKGRELSLQCLYNLDFLRLTSEQADFSPRLTYREVLKNILDLNDIKPGNSAELFSNQLLAGIIDKLPAIDEKIELYLDRTNISSLSTLDRNLLRIAIGEMLYLDTPHPVAINEAIEIAKKFCGEESAKFINGVLDSFAKELITLD
jgi:N utilization substance protein B